MQHSRLPRCKPCPAAAFALAMKHMRARAFGVLCTISPPPSHKLPSRAFPGSWERPRFGRMRSDCPFALRLAAGNPANPNTPCSRCAPATSVRTRSIRPSGEYSRSSLLLRSLAICTPSSATAAGARSAPGRVSAAACTHISARARELLASVRSRSTLPCSVAVLLEAAKDGRADAVRHILKRVTSAEVNATDRYG